MAVETHTDRVDLCVEEAKFPSIWFIVSFSVSIRK